MKLQEMINEVATETGLPKEEVRKIIKSQLSLMAQLIRRQEDFSSSFIGIKARLNPESQRPVGWAWVPVAQNDP